MRTSPPGGISLNRHQQLRKEPGDNSQPNLNTEVGQRLAERTVDNRSSTYFKLLADLLESLIYDLFPGDPISYIPFLVSQLICPEYGFLGLPALLAAAHSDCIHYLTDLIS